MGKRLLGVIALLLLTLMLTPGAASAVTEEAPEEHELPSIEEVVNDNERAQSSVEDPYEMPGFYDPILIPLLIVAVVVLIAVSALYLLWQPRFAQERQAKEKARRTRAGA